LENTSDEIIKLEANLTELYSRQRTYNIVIETIEIWLNKQRRSKWKRQKWQEQNEEDYHKK